MKTIRTIRSSGAAAAAALTVLLMLAGAGTAPAEDGLLPLGGKAPLFQGTDINGKAFSLEEGLSEKAVFLVFWSIF